MWQGSNQKKEQSDRSFPDWFGWFLITLIAIALLGFVALVFYLFL